MVECSSHLRVHTGTGLVPLRLRSDTRGMGMLRNISRRSRRISSNLSQVARRQVSGPRELVWQ